MASSNESMDGLSILAMGAAEHPGELPVPFSIDAFKREIRAFLDATIHPVMFRRDYDLFMSRRFIQFWPHLDDPHFNERKIVYNEGLKYSRERWMNCRPDI